MKKDTLWIVVVLVTVGILGFAWFATTSATVPASVNLLSAGNFAILSKAGITDIPSSVITGDIGTSPITGAAIGVSCPEVTGTIYSDDPAWPSCKVTNPSLLTAAVSDMETAYTDAAGRTSPTATNLGGGNIGGLTIAPGLYKWGTDVLIPSNVILSGGVNDVWIFQISGNLTVATAWNLGSGIKVLLTGGAQASNIFWQVNGSATLGTYSTFNGTILSATSIILQTGAVLNGRALAQTEVELQQNTVTAPTQSMPISLSGPSANTGSTVLTGSTISSGSGLTIDGVITVSSDRTDPNSTTGSLTLSGVTSITVGGSAWDGVLIPPTLIQSGSLQNASTSELSAIIPQTSFITAGVDTITTTYTSTIMRTVKVGGEAGTTLFAVGSDFRVSFIVPNSSSGTTLHIYRSVDGATWTANSPSATCTLDSHELCTFDTDHLSFFAPTLITASLSSTAWGGGGGGGNNSSGGGGSSGGGLSVDNCPQGDASPSYYDGKCTATVVVSTGIVIASTESGVIVETTFPATSTGAVHTIVIPIGVTTIDASGATTRPLPSIATPWVISFVLPKVILASETDIKFEDTANSWAKTYIHLLVARGIVANTDEYDPDDSLTRAEFLKILIRTTGWKVVTLNNIAFDDVETDDWYAPYVSIALSHGIISSTNRDFNPDDDISRAEVAKIIVGAFGADTSDTHATFADVGASSEFSGYIETAKNLGFLSGQMINGQLVFRPHDPITRAEIAKIIAQAFHL